MASTHTKQSSKQKPQHEKVTAKMLKRRAEVLLLLIKGRNNSQIAETLKIDRGTVQKDIDSMLDVTIDWVNNLALIAWMKKVEELYVETNESITHITTLQAQIRDTQTNEKFSFPECPFNPTSKDETEIQNYFKWLDSHRKAQAAFYTRHNQYSEYAQLENAKNKSKEFLVGMTTQIPLFATTQRLAIYYTQNEQKKLQLPDEPQHKTLKVIKSKK